MKALWTESVVTFIQQNLPRTGPDGAWEHRFISAYQIGCEALAALGEAEETGWGARPLHHPGLPEVLPRWDDICVAVLKLAGQQDLLSCRTPSGEEAPGHAAWFGREEGPGLPRPNIAPAHGLGLAHAAPDLLPVLHALGLINAGHWTAVAELVFWRVQPDEWQMDVAADPRFAAAVDRAVFAMPDDVRTEMERLVTITEDDITQELAGRKAYQQELLAEHGRDRVILQPLTRVSVREGLTFVRRHQLDWLLFTSWRLLEGWLKPEARERALDIFHDPLAIQTRQAVVRRLWSEAPGMAD